ncbi:MAG: hypothetical protein ACKVX9_24450 [Blastocatellia bacterium]
MRWKLDNNLQAMSIVAAILILLGGTVVGVYHCWRMLGWIALFPAAGFVFADYLGFHLIFFARKEGGLLGWGSLVCKFVIFGTLLLNGASLVFLLITDAKDKAAIASRIEAKRAELEAETAARVKLIEAESAARQAEDTRRAQNAAEVVQVTGNASLARTVVRASTAATPAPFAAPIPSAFPIASTAAASAPVPEQEAPGIVERFARWYTRGPLYFSGGLVGLLCFVLIQVFGKIGEGRNGSPAAGGDGPERVPARHVEPVPQSLPVPAMANAAPQAAQVKPVRVWRGMRPLDGPGEDGERSH